MALGVQLVHFEVEPSYENVALMDTDHSTSPSLFFEINIYIFKI